MNPIPSISERSPFEGEDADFPVSWNTSYTIIGQVPPEPDWHPSVLVLVEPGFLSRQDLVQTLWARGFRDIMLMDPSSRHQDAEHLCRDWPGVRIMLCDRNLGSGSRINMYMRECVSRFCLVIRSCHTVLPYVDTNLRALLDSPRLCSVPLFRNPRGEVLPALHIPTLREGSFQVLSVLSSRDHDATLYPHDLCGLYDREAFLSLGGFDEMIRKTWWQKIEFGTRAWLWGQEIRCDNTLRIQCALDREAEDSTPDEDYLRISLRLMQPRFQADHAELPSTAWFSWYHAAGGNWWARRRQYKAGKAWVDRHASHYRHDFRYLLEMWNHGELK